MTPTYHVLFQTYIITKEKAGMIKTLSLHPKVSHMGSNDAPIQNSNTVYLWRGSNLGQAFAKKK
jgi:hypothetical protein